MTYDELEAKLHEIQSKIDNLGKEIRQIYDENMAVSFDDLMESLHHKYSLKNSYSLNVVRKEIDCINLLKDKIDSEQLYISGLLEEINAYEIKDKSPLAYYQNQLSLLSKDCEVISAGFKEDYDRYMECANYILDCNNFTDKRLGLASNYEYLREAMSIYEEYIAISPDVEQIFREVEQYIENNPIPNSNKG